MAASLTLSLDKASYNKGETITAHLVVAGNAPATVTVPVSGQTTVGGANYSASGSIQVTTPAAPVTGQQVSAPGYTFTASPTDPNTFTAIA